jgi:hypothetical protein
MLVYEIILLPTQWCVGLLGDVMKIIKSYRDAAYSAALATDTVVDSAKFVHGQCPTFLDDAPEEVVNELNEGFMLRYSETHPAKTYCRIDGNVVENAKGKEKIEVSIYFAMSYTAQAFGALRNEDPQMHAIIKGWRDAWSKYRSNRHGDLKREIKRLIEGPRTRTPIKTFAEVVGDVLDGMVTRCKNAKARGDDTANLDLLHRQVAAFKSVK